MKIIWDTVRCLKIKLKSIFFVCNVFLLQKNKIKNIFFPELFVTSDILYDSNDVPVTLKHFGKKLDKNNVEIQENNVEIRQNGDEKLCNDDHFKSKDPLITISNPETVELLQVKFLCFVCLDIK